MRGLTAFNTDNCWYKEVCTAECSNTCIRFLEMRELCKLSGLPETKWKPEPLRAGRDKAAFEKLVEIKSDIKSFVGSGRSLYLYSSNTGNGKTSMAIKLMLAYFNAVWNGNGFARRGAYVSTAQLCFQYKENISRSKDEFYEYLNDLKTIDLVIWDDLGAAKLSDFDKSLLFDLIDTRVTANKSNIYTTNAQPEEFENLLGSRLYSRTYQQSLSIELIDGDKRAWKGEKFNG